MELWGHVYELPAPCQIYGKYFERTGTILFDCVWCDGQSYVAGALSADELEQFMDELRYAVVWGEF